MMDVLSVTSELYPLVKTGGLADVAGALPGALAEHDVAVRTLIPGYPQVIAALKEGRAAAEMSDLFGGPARLVAARVEGLDLLVLDAPHLYDRAGGIYVDGAGRDWPDNWRRFAALSFVAAELANGLVEGYRPDVLHVHDWQAGLAGAYLRASGNVRTRTVATIHNIAFQGWFDPGLFPGLRLPPSAFGVEGIEYYGGIGFLKSGLYYADAITTVSPTYAREIRRPEFGMGLEGLLTTRAADISGILNGIDTHHWNPRTDPALVETYSPANARRRHHNRKALTKRFGIAQGSGPLFGLVSRLTQQKGIDLVVDTIDTLVSQGGQLVVLGSGEPDLEAALAAAASRTPESVGFIKGYDEPLSHLVQGGVDALLVPSRFEPCGLTQLYALRYGAVPVVSRVGGLADTVIDANPAALAAGAATGVQFSHIDAQGLRDAIIRAVALFREPDVWGRMQRRGMRTDLSWNKSAGEYAALYARVLELDDA